MKFLANENFSLASVLLLRKDGFDVTSISELNPGISDLEVLEMAMKESRIILTHDSDYGAIIFKLGLKPPEGVIYFRLDKFQPEEPALILMEALKTDLRMDNTLTVIDRSSIRQRNY